MKQVVKIIIPSFFMTVSLLLIMPVTAQKTKEEDLLLQLLQSKPELFADVLSNKNNLSVQIIYTKIDREKKNKIRFTDYQYGVNADQYFYPASTVKLPVALLALQKLNELKIPGLDMNSTMITGEDGDRQTEVRNDPSAADGRPTIAHYIKKILLVSDNEAYNRLYEFLGQEYINNSLHKMGYTDVQIIHRLEVFLTEEENRHTNPVTFYDSSGRVLYHQAAERSKLVYAERNTKMGKGYLRGGQLVHEPFDFSRKNRLGLMSLHNILKSILFPQSVEKERRFGLTAADHAFLQKYMSMIPAESGSPSYPPEEAWDTYVKFLYYGAEKNTTEPGRRIFNKPGDAYGFLIDAAYIADFKNGTEFLLSAVIHCNSDGIYNDNTYDYATVGLPFMKQLGRLIASYEQTRVRKGKPDLSSFLFNYSD